MEGVNGRYGINGSEEFCGCEDDPSTFDDNNYEGWYSGDGVKVNYRDLVRTVQCPTDLVQFKSENNIE